VLPFTTSIAPVARWLTAIHPWLVRATVGTGQARGGDLDVHAGGEEGDKMRRLTKGLLPILMVVGVLALLALLRQTSPSR
jgi:hypothetical protein